MFKEMYHRRTRDFEVYDRIELKVVPRYKTSGLSGDEWRTSVQVDFWFKGQLIKSVRRSTMQFAVMFLASDFYSDMIPKEVRDAEKSKCDQPGCDKLAVGFLSVGKLTADDGAWLDMADQSLKYYRQFCTEHIKRGDCDREDCDENYTPLNDLSAEDSTNTKESPSAFGGTMEIQEFPKN